MKFSKVIFGFLLCGLVFSSLPTPGSWCIAQQEQVTIKAYQLRNAAAAQSEILLQQMFASKNPDKAQNMRISAEARTNTIIVMADEASHREIAVLIKLIDIPAIADEKTIMHKSRSGLMKNPKFLDQLSNLWNVHIAYDPGTDIMLIKGEHGKVEQLTEIIQNMESEQPAIAAESRVVRLAWLTSKSQNRNAKPLSADLERVVPKLQMLGMEDVGVACQLLARYETEEIEVMGHANLNEKRIKLGVHAYEMNNQPNSYMFRIVGTQDDGKSLFQLNIGAKLSVGKTIVLAASPIQLDTDPITEIQSVFVVQLVEGL
jgi:hypothetical protein